MPKLFYVLELIKISYSHHYNGKKNIYILSFVLTAYLDQMQFLVEMSMKYIFSYIFLLKEPEKYDQEFQKIM